MNGRTVIVRARRQAGAASLIVVMVLFFVMSMVAAYTNRNLIFEQRTAGNQLKSTRALEAAEAGLQWALTMLNSGRITATCTPSTNVADTSFRQRYLSIDASNGNIIPRKRSDGVTPLYPTCVYNGTSWDCDCPTDAAPSVTAPTGTDVYPAFRLQFRRMCGDVIAADTACTDPSQPSVIHIDINGCTSLNDSCLGFPWTAVDNEGHASLHATLALRGDIRVVPGSALTVRQGGSLGSVSMKNDEHDGTGTTLHSGASPTGGNYFGRPGTPPDSTKRLNDSAIDNALMTSDRMFANTFGMWRNTFQEQPSTVTVDCSVSCSASTLRSKIALNPGRSLWVVGNLDIDSSGDIGSAAEPVLVNVTGNVGFSAAATVYGLVYSQAATWNWTGSGEVVGGVVAENAVNATAATDVTYNSSVLKRLKNTSGSFVVVPGTWRDWNFTR